MKKNITIILILLLGAVTVFLGFKYYEKSKRENVDENGKEKEVVLKLTTEEIDKKIESMGFKNLHNYIEYENYITKKFRTNVNLFENHEIKSKIVLMYNDQIEKILRDKDEYKQAVYANKEIFKSEYEKMWNETISEKTHEFDGDLVKCYNQDKVFGIPNFEIKAKSINYDETKKEYTIDFKISEKMTFEMDENNQFNYRYNYSDKYIAQLKFKYSNNTLKLISYKIVNI